MKEFTKCKVCDSEIELINQKFNLVKCTACKLIFTKTFFSEEDFIATYNQLYNDSLQYNTHQKEFEKLKKGTNINIGKPKLKILKYLLKNDVNNICEIGAGVGIVANFLKKKKVNYFGIELDKETVCKARSINLNIVEGDFSTLNNVDECFDAIVAFEVIEHLQDLKLFLQIAFEKLESQKYLGFTVPNYDKRMNYSKPGDNIFQSGPPIHLNFFTIESIKNIASQYDFEIIFCKAKRFPYFNWNKSSTYKFFLMSLFGRFNGATLQCVMIKK